MDWYSFLWGIVFVLAGIIMILMRYEGSSKDDSWLDIGNARLISGGIFGIVMGLYFIITSL
ncbi:hypothetical protein DXT99_25830 [Pontibacter diazotrophicus]|uniref:Uncharacterized protein n=1 Tax=Pontibacter diazotrophicus TaxID=1400979 RepID=A0A3D8L081_9BACT|nr:hypothetical protein DXT99_25830 [Pontibacter diazotrophicus]